MRNKKFFAFLAALAVLIASPAVLFGADANSDIKTYVNGKELEAMLAKYIPPEKVSFIEK